MQVVIIFTALRPFTFQKLLLDKLEDNHRLWLFHKLVNFFSVTDLDRELIMGKYYLVISTNSWPYNANKAYGNKINKITPLTSI